MSDPIRDTLQAVQARQRAYDMFVEAPASAARIADLREVVRRELGGELPEGYASFLGLSDGLDWNGTVFYGVERRGEAPGRPFRDGLVEANLDARGDDRLGRLLVLGESGSVYHVHDAGDGFRTLDRVSLDTLATFGSFEELFTATVRTLL